MLQTQIGETPDAPVLAAAKRFGRFRPEEEKAARPSAAKNSGVLDLFWEIWKLPFRDAKNGSSMFSEFYQAACEAAKQVRYTAADVEFFSIALIERQDEFDFSSKAGLVISALINSGKDKSFMIHTRGLDAGIHSLGYHNTKDIVVKGDVGGDFAVCMEGGLAIVEGNAGNRCGAHMKGGRISVSGSAGSSLGVIMEGGEILVLGDCRIDNWAMGVGKFMKGGSIIVMGRAESVGHKMKGGRITISGDAGALPGDFMEGGEIHLNGGYGRISTIYIRHGRIYHQGKLIVDK